MAGKDDLADAVLGGASDFMADIVAKMANWYEAEDDQKVRCMHVSVNVCTVCMYACVHIYCVYACMYICMYVCM